MIAALGLLAALVAPQDTVGLSPRARAMLDRFVPPIDGAVSVATRFSDDTVWIGEQVELVTAIWFPRELRQRLRRQPSLRSPTLAGMWSAPASMLPELAETRRVSGVVLDLYVSHQTLFPLGAGVVEASPAVLSFAVPSSTSFFAPEERREVSSRRSRLVVRPIPPDLAARLGSGPTARDMRLQWRVPDGTVRVGTPVTVELVLTGRGNVALWPTPELIWPPTVRVYAEPTEEEVRRPGGVVAGEKRFRYTLVADSAGVVTLPRVRYPHFDPARAQVVITSASPLGIAVRALGVSGDRATVPASRVLVTPWASRLVRDWWPLLVLIGMAPPVLAAFRRRSAPAPRPAPDGSLEVQLRRLIGQGAEATPAGIERALRRRGATRDEAREVREWLEGTERHRWSAGHPEPPADHGIRRIVERLRGQATRVAGGAGFLLVCVVGALPGQWQEALDRYREGDATGAERLFAAVVEQHPASPDAWLDLGAARWMAGDDVGSAAAWIRGLRVAPRDARLHDALAAVPNLPGQVRALVPVVPLNRDELLLVAVAGWMLAWLTWRRVPRLGRVAAVVTAATAAFLFWRMHHDGASDALVRSGHVLRVSPVVTAPEVGQIAGWSLVRLERQRPGWWLVRVGDGQRGWLPEAGVAPLSRLD